MSKLHQVLVITAHAATGWALCFATMGVGLAVSTLQPPLIAHAIGAPIYFSGVSAFYFTHFAYTRPLPTALLFTGFVIAVDLLLVAMVILRSFDMFVSPLGTWIPFALIFASTWVTGIVTTRRPFAPVHATTRPGTPARPARRGTRAPGVG